jgi:DNA helicase-2/ATP-dependent DNA helicase PcrA
MTDFTPNPGQQKAIDAPSDQPVRIVAGAGTGKTEVISRRFIHLFERHPGLRPKEILVLTFSSKAAAEMRARIFRAVTDASLGFDRLDLAAADISTFHAFGMRLLGDWSLLAGIDAELPRLTDADVLQLLDEAQQAFLVDGFSRAYGAFDPVGNEDYDWKGDKPFKAAWNIFNQLRNQALSPEECHNNVVAIEELTEEHRILAPLVHWLHDAYLARLAERGQLDFDRIVTEAAWMLEQNPMVQERVRAQYRYLLVDEYQDTNHAQERLLRSLAASGLSNVTVVGDPRQAIYIWREARVENIAHFPGDGQVPFGAPLKENHRSLEPILSVANRAIQGYAFGSPAEFSLEDKLEACEEYKQFTGTVVDLHPSPTRAAEAEAIVAWIHQAGYEGYDYRDIAILMRARTHISAYTDALEKAQIPFELSSEDAFYTRPEILDAIHLLRTCLNPADELSLARSLLSPAAGLAQPQVAALRLSGRGALWTRVCDPAALELSEDLRTGLSRFLDFWQKAQVQRWQLGPAAFAAWVIHQSGLYAEADSGGQRAQCLSDCAPPRASLVNSRRRALQKLLALTHGYEAAHPAESLGDMAEYLRRVLDGDPRAKAPELSSGENAVRVMTAHASKGLEFPVVIAADSRQKIRPNRSNQPFHEPNHGLIFPDRDKKVEDDPLVLERIRRQRNEARCLWYVTVTRAQCRLIVTATNEKELAGGKFEKASTFFEELWNYEAGSKSDGVALNTEPPKARPTASTEQVTAKSVDLAASAEVRSNLQARLVTRSNIQTSTSAFLRFQQCPAAYRLYHVDRMEALDVTRDDQDVQIDDGAGRAMGTAFHRLIAMRARQPSATFEELTAAAGIELVADQLATVKSWYDRYLQDELETGLAVGPLVEYPLSLALDFPTARLVVGGIADRLEPKRLIDYKTGVRREGLVERYGDQLRIYALAARQAGRLSTDSALVIYHIPTAATVSVPFSADDEARLLRELEDFASRLVQPERVLAPVPGQYCTWCAAREHFCVIGQRWQAGSQS